MDECLLTSSLMLFNYGYKEVGLGLALYSISGFPICMSLSLYLYHRLAHDAKLRLPFHESSWQIETRLGEGAFGVVNLVSKKRILYMGEKRMCARKEIEFQDPSNSEEVGTIVKEIDIMWRLNHRNIVKIESSLKSKDGKYLYIYMDYISSGTLEGFIWTNRNLSEEQCREFASQIVDGLKYLHDKDVIHRDIKPGNILLNENNVIKLADFGVARMLRGNSVVTSYVGTQLYMAKEVFSCEYNEKCDIWSTGIVVMEMLTGSNPWSDYKCPEAAMFAIYVQKKLPNYQELDASEELKDFLSLTFKDVAERPDASELTSHAWLHPDPLT